MKTQRYETQSEALQHSRIYPRSWVSLSVYARRPWFLFIPVILLCAGCANMTPDQINATTNAITSVVTTAGEVVTPLVVNYENGRSVRVARPRATPKPPKQSGYTK